MHSFSNSRMILTLKISKGYKDKHFEKQYKSRNGCSTAKMPKIRRQDLVFHVECRRCPNQLHEQWPPHFFSFQMHLHKSKHVISNVLPYLHLEHSQFRLFAVLTKNLFSRLLRTSATAANFVETLLLWINQKISSHALSPGPSGRESPSGACLRPQPVRAVQ